MAGGARGDATRGGMGSRGCPRAAHDEGHGIPVLLRNANSFVIILIYAPVSRRATHRRRRPTGVGAVAGTASFTRSWLSRAPEISFPAFLAASADVYAMPGRDVSGGFVWSGRARAAPRRAALPVTCASTRRFIRLPDGMCDVIARVQSDYAVLTKRLRTSLTKRLSLPVPCKLRASSTTATD